MVEFAYACISSSRGFFFFKIKIKLKYEPGKANDEFARRFGHLVNAKVRTVGEAFAEFTNELGYTVNSLYKNMITDLVGTTHLIVVSARFQRDPIWSLGIMTALDLLLKNYPERDVAERIISSLFKCCGLDEDQVRAEAKSIEDWAQGKTRADIEAALKSGDPSTPVGAIAQKIKADEFWMYSRYFGLGLVRLMEIVGVEMDKDEVYPIMENWMSEQLGRSHLTACVSGKKVPDLVVYSCDDVYSYQFVMISSIQNDSDMYFKVKSKLDMMETMMKEIEIREKKRMAERLERKAEEALRAAEREGKFQAEIESESQKMTERV